MSTAPSPVPAKVPSAAHTSTGRLGWLVLPALLRGGMGFWAALGLSCLMTMALYAATVWALGRFGISL